MNFNKFFIIILLAVFFILPKNTVALQVYNNVNIDYRFFFFLYDVGNLKFRLYDKTGTLNFESQYDSNKKHYYFEHDEIGFEENENNYYGDYLIPYDYQYDNYEDDYRSYVPYKEQLLSFDSNDVILFKKILSDNKIHGGYGLFHEIEDIGSNFYFYTYVPMILEETESHAKKIVFSSFAYAKIFSLFGYHGDFVQLFLVNNTSKNYNNYMLKDTLLENVDFMRKLMLDYSDELWEELNSGPIASSEIYSDNLMSISYKYLNQMLGTGEKNVPEETFEDYANSLPLLSFKKENNSNNDVNEEDNNINIVDVITNPQTWNNGIVILVISIMIIISCSYLFIRKRNI